MATFDWNSVNVLAHFQLRVSIDESRKYKCNLDQFGGRSSEKAPKSVQVPNRRIEVSHRFCGRLNATGGSGNGHAHPIAQPRLL